MTETDHCGVATGLAHQGTHADRVVQLQCLLKVAPSGGQCPAETVDDS